MPKTICIDPGHGGFDSGAVGNGMQEKDITLAIGLQLKAILEAAGIDVVMTRTEDVAPGGGNTQQAELEARCRIANDANVDLFISIHVNDGGGHGAEAYIYGNDSTGHALAAAIVEQFAPVMGNHGEPIKDGSGLWVIGHTNAPAILVEVGFIDSGDAVKIKDHLHDFAVWMAKPLIPFLGGTAKEMPPVKDWECSPYKTAVDYVKDKGWMRGYSETVFGVNDNLTRGQMAQILFNMNHPKG
jgi:N-acetylmuramoyl-L-alanine amidase